MLLSRPLSARIGPPEVHCGRHVPLLHHTSLVSGKPDEHWGLHVALLQQTSCVSGKGWPSLPALGNTATCTP